MLTESELTAEIRAGLQAVTPPAPWLAAAVEKRLRASRQPSGTHRTPRVLRLGLNVIALFILIALAVAAVGVFVDMHRRTVPVRTGSGPVIFPTRMISPTTGWALVGNNELWRTSDGGTSWTDVSPPHLSDRVINADLNSFLDGKHALITELGGGKAGNLDFYWESMRTVDGGRTWQRGKSLKDPFHPGNAGQSFIDANTGWLILSDMSLQPAWPIIYATHDGGLNWSLVTSEAGLTATSGTSAPCAADAVLSSAATGWMTAAFCEEVAPGSYQATRDLLLVTRDGGITWRVQTLPVAATSFEPVFFDELHGILVVGGSHPTLLATSDGGYTWSVRSLPGEAQGNVDFVDPNHGWAVAGPSSMFVKTKDNSQRIIPLPLYHTDDGGATWTPVRTNIFLEQPVGVVFFNFHFVDQKIGFATLFTLALGPSEFLETTNGGRTWNVVRACRAGLGWSSNPPPACPQSSP